MRCLPSWDWVRNGLVTRLNQGAPVPGLLLESLRRDILWPQRLVVRYNASQKLLKLFGPPHGRVCLRKRPVQRKAHSKDEDGQVPDNCTWASGSSRTWNRTSRLLSYINSFICLNDFEFLALAIEKKISANGEEGDNPRSQAIYKLLSSATSLKTWFLSKLLCTWTLKKNQRQPLPGRRIPGFVETVTRVQ